MIYFSLTWTSDSPNVIHLFIKRVGGYSMIPKCLYIDSAQYTVCQCLLLLYFSCGQECMSIVFSSLVKDRNFPKIQEVPLVRNVEKSTGS